MAWNTSCREGGGIEINGVIFRVLRVHGKSVRVEVQAPHGQLGRVLLPERVEKNAGESAGNARRELKR